MTKDIPSHEKKPSKVIIFLKKIESSKINKVV